MKTKILLTGGSGFLGSNISKFLGDPCRGLSKRDLDVTDRHSILSALDKYQPEIIVNCASYGNYRHHADIKNCNAVNVVGVENLIESIVNSQKDIKLIHIGSYSEYGIKHEKMHEDMVCAPVTEYGRTKLEGAKLCIHSGKNELIRSVVIRTSSLYGYQEPDYRMIPTLFRCYFRNETFQCWARNAMRDFTLVSDVAYALEIIASKLDDSDWGEVYNLSAGRGLTVEECVHAFIESVGHVKFSVSDDTVERQDSPVWCGSTKKVRNRFNMNRFSNLKNGLGEVQEHFLNRYIDE